MRVYKVKPDQFGQRLDVFVAGLLKPSNRALAHKLLLSGKVIYNDQPGAKPAQKLKSGDKIKVAMPSKAIPPKINLTIIYEDGDCIVINKPSGVLSHSKGEFNPEATVASFIAPKLKDLSGERAGIVHRLDRDTSGVIICAKTQSALRHLQKQFARRQVQKTYHAIISGVPKQPAALIDMPIGRSIKDPKTFRVDPSGRPAQTKYQLLKEFGLKQKYSLIKLEPVTGRTHQLRVHLAKIGHPVVGDRFYGGQQFDRLLLHASALTISLTKTGRREFKAPLPKEFDQFEKSQNA